jgi:uncharacterized protein
MKIQIAGLSEGIHEYHFDIAAAELGLGKEYADAVSVDATLDRTANEFLLTARIKAASTVVCDRCVTPFMQTLSPSYQMYYVWNDTDATRFDSSEVQVIPSGLSVIDLTEDVRQTVLLAVPFKILCRDDCKGLCPHCGKNLNEGSCTCTDVTIDSRWDRLRSTATDNADESM